MSYIVLSLLLQRIKKYKRLNTELFIAKRIFSGKDERSISRPIIRLSIIGIALGLIVMILTIAIVSGYKKEIRSRISSFAAHITISNFDSNNSYETIPINRDQSFYPSIIDKKGIKHIRVFATKAGIIKTDSDVQGVLLKGVGRDFKMKYFDKYIIEGTYLSLHDSVKSNDILMSSSMAKKLKLKIGDKVTTYFMQQPTRIRRFVLAGIYESSLEDFNSLILCDIRHIQKLNKWEENQIGGFEVFIDNFEEIDEVGQMVYDMVGYQFARDGSRLQVETIKQKYSQIFNWLDLFNTNTMVILVLMISVAAFNMISGLLIVILERTNMIGILKSLGTENWSIRKVFLYNAVLLIGPGMLWGNVIGLGLCFLQSQFSIVTLDPASYYVSTVPINIELMPWLALNIGTFIITLFSLLLPSYLITKINPSEAIRFE